MRSTIVNRKVKQLFAQLDSILKWNLRDGAIFLPTTNFAVQADNLTQLE